MRAWERQEGESARAYEAFGTYRDLGPQRSLAKVGHMLGKSVGLMERWSRQHEWVSRIEALAARDEMLRREAVEEHMAAKAEDHAKRRAALAEKALEIAEAAADQALLMIQWPLSEKTVEQEGPDGEVQVFRISPARWTKANIRPLFDVTVSGATGNLRAAEDNSEEPEEFDFDGWTDEEVREYMRLSEKLSVRRPDRR